MHDDVKICVSSRVDFFDTYYDAPPQMQDVVAAFIAEVKELGERSADVQEFEAQFVSLGLSDRFNAILPKCTPKAVPVTAEQKAYAKEVRREMWEEQKGQIAKDAVADIAESVSMRAESDIRQASIRTMSDAGVLDEYTRASNVVDDVGYAAKFLTKLFKNKKKPN